MVKRLKSNKTRRGLEPCHDPLVHLPDGTIYLLDRGKFGKGRRLKDRWLERRKEAEKT